RLDPGAPPLRCAARARRGAAGERRGWKPARVSGRERDAADVPGRPRRRGGGRHARAGALPAALRGSLRRSLARLDAERVAEGQGIRVVMTRSDDRDVPAEQRAELANRVQADLVLALHFDGYVDPHARGATAFCPPATVTEPERLDLSTREADATAVASSGSRPTSLARVALL